MTLEQKIVGVLFECGIFPNMQGFLYLKAAVEICYDDEENRISYTKELYPEIAKRYHTSAIRVERCIRYAIDKTKSPHSNSQFIRTAIWFIKQLE